jgi:RNA polymerase sigma factor FliA
LGSPAVARPVLLGFGMNTPESPRPGASTKVHAEYEFARLLPLVHQTASRLMRRLPSSIQRDDLIAAGTVGLLQALRDGRNTGDEMFAAYARIRIRGAMLDELRRGDWAPRRKRGGESPPVAVVRFDDLPPTVVFAADGTSPLERLEQARELSAMTGAMELLPEREREILRLRYFEQVPSKSIAASMGLSEARVSQLHARATARLLRALEDEEGVVHVVPPAKLAA